MKRIPSIFALCITTTFFGWLLFMSNFSIVQAQGTLPVVHAVLFYSPTCPHCHTVIEETLPPLLKKYGNQLQIIKIDITVPEGKTLFLAAIEKFSLESSGVPFLVIGDSTYLTGSLEIPEKFPGIIENALKQGGIDWPHIPGLDARLANAEQTAATSTETIATESNSFIFSHDPAGGALSLLILLGMIFSAGWVVIPLLKQRHNTFETFFKGKMWQVLILCILGLGVAGYLTYIETTQTTAICGPVGDCNTVQQSPYARLFGILPVGLLGMLGYLLIAAAYLLKNYGQPQWKKLASVSLFGMVLFGVLFSIYLTSLEIFVIQAVCLWCLSSAVISTLLLLIGTISFAKPQTRHRHSSSQ